MALALDLIHTTLGRATLPLPESGTKLVPQRQAATGSASPKRPMLPQMLSCFMYLPSKELSTLAPSRERPWYHGKSGDGSAAQLSGT